MSVASYRELMAEQHRAAVRVSGAHHSSWNGRLAVAAPERKVRGVARWDHTIEYADDTVNTPLKDMFANARVHNQDPETLQSYREAVKTVLHENTHLLAAEGSEHRDAEQAFQNPSVRALEEGITEVYSYTELDRYIDDLGLEEIAPGISSADAKPSYKQFTPAAGRFAESIGRRSGLESDDVVNRLAVVNAEQKFRVAAELVYDNSDLPGLVPDQERAAAIGRIEAAMKPAFADLDTIDKTDDQRQRRESAKAGAQAANAGYSEVRSLKQQWSMPAPEQQVQRGAATEQARTGKQAQSQVPSTDARGQQEPQAPQEPNVSALPADLAAAARAGLTGSKPLSSASRLSEDRQGSRATSTSAPGQQRQGPEAQR
jgi:hypothetical protein